MEIGYVTRSHDRQEDKEVREANFFRRIHKRALNPLISALSLRLFGKDITTVGQQKVKNQNENQTRGQQTATPVEHPPMLEDREPTPAIDGDYVPGEMEENSET